MLAAAPSTSSGGAPPLMASRHRPLLGHNSEYTSWRTFKPLPPLSDQSLRYVGEGKAPCAKTPGVISLSLLHPPAHCAVRLIRISTDAPGYATDNRMDLGTVASTATPPRQQWPEDEHNGCGASSSRSHGTRKRTNPVSGRASASPWSS